MSRALGLVETRGLVAAIEAADAMAKASGVKLVGKEKTNPALITIKVVGDVAAVKASVEAGAAAAARVGQVVSTHIIPQPDHQLADLFPEINEDELSADAEASAEPSYLEALNEVLPEPEDTTEIEQSPADLPAVEFEPAESTGIDDLSEELNEPEESSNDDYAPVTYEEETAEPEVVYEAESSESSLTDESVIYVDEPEQVIPDKYEEEPEQTEETNEGQSAEIKAADETAAEDLFSQAERIENKKSVKKTQEKVSFIQSLQEEEPIEKPQAAAADANNTVDEDVSVLHQQPLDTLNVHELRRLARHTTDFPIQGREISKANRQELLYYFKSLK